MEQSTQLRPTDVTLSYKYEGDVMSLDWWQKNVMYHVYLPSFKDGNGDGTGDFQGHNFNLYLFSLKYKYLCIKLLA